jgi:hypothetical protein
MSQNINLFGPQFRKQQLAVSMNRLVACLAVTLLALIAYQVFTQQEVNGLAEELHRGLDHARVARQAREGRAVHVRGEIGAHRVAAFFAHVLRAVLGIQRRHLVKKASHLLWREQARE